jgi:hypothetical protein
MSLAKQGCLVTASLPVLRTIVYSPILISILAVDWDPEQTVRCRWASELPRDECGNGCSDLPNADLNPIDCVIVWNPILRPQDIANGLNSSTYIVAIVVEDFINDTSNTPLSATPHQMLIEVFTPPVAACSIPPRITGATRRSQSCFGEKTTRRSDHQWAIDLL